MEDKVVVGHDDVVGKGDIDGLQRLLDPARRHFVSSDGMAIPLVWLWAIMTLVALYTRAFSTICADADVGGIDAAAEQQLAV
jgi:hypothetical protein